MFTVRRTRLTRRPRLWANRRTTDLITQAERLPVRLATETQAAERPSGGRRDGFSQSFCHYRDGPLRCHLKGRFKDVTVSVVTGELTSDERRGH